MDMKTILLLIIAGVLANNYAMQNFLGIETVLGKCTCAKKSLILGFGVTVVMLVSTLLTKLISVPASLSLYFFVLVVLAVSTVVEALLKLLSKKSLGNAFLLLGLNAAVLGACLMNGDADLATTLLSALGAGLGLTVAMLVYGQIRDRVEDKYAPKAMRGLPLSLLTAGMICLALGCLAFK